MITQSEAPAPGLLEVHKHQRDLSSLSSETVETGGTRESVTSEKRIPYKKIYIKYLSLSPL